MPNQVKKVCCVGSKPTAVRPSAKVSRLLANCIIYYNACILSELLERAERRQDILGVAQSPKIQSIKGDKRNGHVAVGTFV
jgi:hypothetical protein